MAREKIDDVRGDHWSPDQAGEAGTRKAWERLALNMRLIGPPGSHRKSQGYPDDKM